MIYIGTAGIPAACKGKLTREGIECVSRMGLSAMEVEFVRGVRMGEGAARKVKIAADKFNIRLSAHAPYFINLSVEDSVEKAKSFDI